MDHFCYLCLSISCSLLVICWERADLLARLYVMFSCAFVTFPYGILGQVWYLIVSVHDLCFLSYINCWGSVYDLLVFVLHYFVSFLASNHLDEEERELVVLLLLS